MAVGLLAAMSNFLLAQGRDLTTLDLEELANVKVTSVAKREQSLLEVPAAAYVITQDDIRRSGATCLPDLLRTVPGMVVAQADGNQWAISARGYNGQWANKLLVLIDGRTVYTPLYSGVYWDAQDLLLSDIERVEVIRGPGATMWGANAVNGVINVITKHARDTQGGWFSVGASTTERRFGELRYGGRFLQNGFFRASTKYFKRDGLIYGDGQRSPDLLDTWRGGFRADMALTSRDELSWQGAAYAGNAGERVDRYASIRYWKLAVRSPA
jgi:iron complex outermembrane receptor protein